MISTVNREEAKCRKGKAKKNQNLPFVKSSKADALKMAFSYFSTIFLEEAEEKTVPQMHVRAALLLHFSTSGLSLLPRERAKLLLPMFSR